jgi:hypothetical protein
MKTQLCAPVLSLVVLVTLQPGLPAFQPAAGPVDVLCDFRAEVLPPQLELVSDPEGEHVRPSPAGLEITILKPWIHPWGGVGVRTAFGLRGDFEVTATYEILQADPPTDGFGVGVAMRPCG